MHVTHWQPRQNAEKPEFGLARPTCTSGQRGLEPEIKSPSLKGMTQTGRRACSVRGPQTGRSCGPECWTHALLACLVGGPPQLHITIAKVHRLQYTAKVRSEPTRKVNSVKTRAGFESCCLLQRPQQLPTLGTNILSIGGVSYTSFIHDNNTGNYLSLYIECSCETPFRVVGKLSQ